MKKIQQAQVLKQYAKTVRTQSTRLYNMSLNDLKDVKTIPDISEPLFHNMIIKLCDLMHAADMLESCLKMCIKKDKES